MSVNFNNSVEAVELKILQVEEKLNDGDRKNFISVQNNAAMQGKVTIYDIYNVMQITVIITIQVGNGNFLK